MIRVTQIMNTKSYAVYVLNKYGELQLIGNAAETPRQLRLRFQAALREETSLRKF